MTYVSLSAPLATQLVRLAEEYRGASTRVLERKRFSGPGHVDFIRKGHCIKTVIFPHCVDIILIIIIIIIIIIIVVVLFIYFI